MCLSEPGRLPSSRLQQSNWQESNWQQSALRAWRRRYVGDPTRCHPHATQSSGSGEEQLSRALLARLQLRKLLLQAVSRLRQRTKQDLDAAGKCLARAAGELTTVRASSSLGSISGGGDDDDAWAALGFDPTLNSHLAPPAPPRVVKVAAQAGAHASSVHVCHSSSAQGSPCGE